MQQRLISSEFAAEILPTEPAKVFDRWDDYLYQKVNFNMADSKIHSYGHTERVLFHALNVGRIELADDPEALEILAHASLFHDTRREDDYIDTGHGARGAVHYETFCHTNPEMNFHREAVYLMRYHDMDDLKGIQAINRDFPEDAERVRHLYAIFKDADALDRWRLGSCGLDPRYIRTAEARRQVDLARELVRLTMDPTLLHHIETLVMRSIGDKTSETDDHSL